MSRRFLFLCSALAIAGIVVLGVVARERWTADRAFAEQVALAKQEAERIRQQVVLFSELRVSAGVTFSDSLQRMGLDPVTSANIVGTAQAVFDLRHMRAGNWLAIGRSVAGDLRAVRYQIDADRMLWIWPAAAGFAAEIKPIPSHTATAGVIGEVKDSLFNAVTDAGESPELAMRLAEIFGWDLDFYTDPRVGDTFRVVVEKKTYANGQAASYGRILAAEYNNAGHPYQAVLFRAPSGASAYYTPDGKSLKKAFLRSPLKFAAPVTSHFSRNRFHPILKVHRAHPGIDYGAPTGTPVQTIANGRVVFAGRKGGAGNLVHIQHANGYETMYMHLSRILVRPGQRVEQGQRIGLVGSTGLATGPHLDFRILQRGAYRNFEVLRAHLPPSEPVAKKLWPQFVAARDQAVALLPDLKTYQARQGGQAPSAQPPPPASSR